MMRWARRGPVRGRQVVWWAAIAALVGSAALLYRVYERNQPLTTISEAPGTGGFSTPIDGATEAAPVASLVDVLNLRRAELERDPNAPVLGNPAGDVTVVEFFDYNCPFCKRVAADIERLIEEDRGVRLVYREWPILGRDSVLAAQAALAARRQGKYEELHRALMAQPRVTESSILQAAQAAGLDVPRLINDMGHQSVAQHIALSMDLARSLAINGTPTFVIGDRVARGLIPPDQLREYVRQARAAKGTQ